MIAVLITVHNRIEETRRCLRDLEAAMVCSKTPTDIFLVDDASTDGTTEVLKAEFPKVKLISGDGNLYWNRGMRLAWTTAAAHANYDYYLWLNNDTYLLEGSLQELLAASHHFGDTEIICGQTISESLGELTYGGTNHGLKPLIYDQGYAQCDIINGNCVLIPKSVFESVGYLDQRFPHAIGDHDYSIRAIKLGRKSYAIQQPLAYCESNDSIEKWLDQMSPFRLRIEALYNPLCPGHPIHFFRYRLRHFGIRRAIRDFLSTHITVAAPSLKKPKQ